MQLRNLPEVLFTERRAVSHGRTGTQAAWGPVSATPHTAHPFPGWWVTLGGPLTLPGCPLATVKGWIGMQRPGCWRRAWRRAVKPLPAPPPSGSVLALWAHESGLAGRRGGCAEVSAQGCAGGVLETGCQGQAGGGWWHVSLDSRMVSSRSRGPSQPQP